jgi:ATP:corrinoid adenosyltransferase
MKRIAGNRHREEKDQKTNCKKTQDTDARKGREVAKHGFFPMIFGSGRSKSTSVQVM